MKITICSSTNFSEKIIEIKKELEKKGHEVFIPYLNEKIMNGELSLNDFLKEKQSKGDISFRETSSIDMFKRYWEYIKNTDVVLVLNLDKNGIKNYIGGSVLTEMVQAHCRDKKIYLYNPIPEKSERVHYIDEILDVKPVVIDGDLSKIK